MNWLFDAFVDLADVARSHKVDEIDSHLGDVLRSLHGALFQMSEALVQDVCLPPPPVVADVVGVAVMVVVGSPLIFVSTAKYILAVKLEAAPMAPPLIRRVP